VSPSAYRRGVGIVLIDRRGLVFVGSRSDARNAWQMPQGGIDAGEEPVDAAWRELWEEAGTRKARLLAETPGWLTYDLPPDIAGRIWGGRYRGQEQKWFAMRFAGRDEDIDLDAHHTEFRAWRWASPGEVLAEIVPFKRKVYQSVLATFAPYLVPEAAG
jgi:putative (di)nucleoside polyphosphate hydrolase